MGKGNGETKKTCSPKGPQCRGVPGTVRLPALLQAPEHHHSPPCLCSKALERRCEMMMVHHEYPSLPSPDSFYQIQAFKDRVFIIEIFSYIKGWFVVVFG